jgi:ABC-type molybdenum transport system ATPase subunit/photorepair protein PhrA
MKTFFSDVMQRLQKRDFFILNIEYDKGAVFTDITITDNQGNAVIIYGENAAGKSLFATLMELLAKEDKISCRSASMRNRTASSMEKAMIFGDEGSQSTGATSVHVAKLCLNSTLKESGSAIAFLDEPDVGLSDYYTPAVGEFIADTMNDAPDNKGVVLVSHAKTLIQRFLDTYQGNVSTIGVNTTMCLVDWLKRNDTATVDELFALKEEESDKNIAIIRALNKK